MRSLRESGEKPADLPKGTFGCSRNSGLVAEVPAFCLLVKPRGLLADGGSLARGGRVCGGVPLGGSTAGGAAGCRCG